jgi:bifunctional non-homologous end joining protein LigD
VAYLPGAFPA